MRIALIGYGKMGHEIENISISRGHEIVCIIDENNQSDFNSSAFRSADVAIEFSTPDAAYKNYLNTFEHNIPVVAGTTGWLSHFDEIRDLCKDNKQTFFYASNYSVGVNIFFALNKYLAKLMNQFTDYNVEMEETHHIHKLDAPSGTAITLAEGLIDNLDRKNKWTMNNPVSSEVYIGSIREGEVPGNHKIKYFSKFDSITIEHDAKNRKGFALGAVLAAEFVKGKKGFLTMSDIFKF